jgi:hypothetical protein
MRLPDRTITKRLVTEDLFVRTLRRRPNRWQVARVAAEEGRAMISDDRYLRDLWLRATFHLEFYI